MQAHLHAALHAQGSGKGRREAEAPAALGIGSNSNSGTYLFCIRCRWRYLVMKSVVSALSFALFFVACASSNQPSGPNVTLQLQPLNQPSDVFYFSGPINLQYHLAINNPTNQELTLTRLDLRTFGPGAYSVRTSAMPMNLRVAPNSTTVYTISVWGYSRGGYLSATEPVTLQGTGYFKGPSGTFVRIFNQNISPLAGA
jgi:hypothetical protein